jgi:DNA primase
MENSLEFLEDGKRVDILQMPGNQDPDEYIREHGKSAFDGLVTNGTTPLSEFLIREVRKPTGESLDKQFNLTTAEGRAQLIHEAKPLLQRIAAPILRTQVTKVIAGLAELTQAEVEAQCDLKPIARGRRSAPPQRRTIQVSQVKTLLRAVLRRPERAARLPLEQIDTESPEGAALHVIANAIEHGELASGNMGLVIEHFRGSPHEAMIGAFVTAATIEEVDEGEEETVFEDTLARMRHAELGAKIDVLTTRARAGHLAADEQAELARLLAAKTRRPAQ